MRRLVVAVVSIALCACGSKDDGAKTAGDKPAPKPTGAPSPAMPAPPPPSNDVHMSCDRLVAKAIVDKYLGGLELDAKQQQRGEHLVCQWKRKEPMAIVSINFQCKEAVYASMTQSIAMMT